MATTSTPTAEQLLTKAKVSLLLAGGVDNWDWYGDSLENYEESADPYEDDANFLNALEIGGVDNWEWYGESLTGLREYEEYLDGLDDIATAVDFDTWKATILPGIEAEQTAAANVAAAEKAAAVIVAAAQADLEKYRPKGDTELQVLARIVELFGEEDADRIFRLAKDNGLWHYNTWDNKDFSKATSAIKKGVENPIEVARAELFRITTKNGKMDKFLKSLV
jgi:hypothetical protein